MCPSFAPLSLPFIHSFIIAWVLHIRVVYKQIETDLREIEAFSPRTLQILLQRQHHRRYASNPQRNRTAIHFEVRERLAAELGERTHIATQHLTVQLARKAVNRPQIVHDLDQKPRVDGYRGGQRAGRGLGVD